MAYRCLQRIRGDERTRKISLSLLTSSKEDPDIQKCYELGVNSYVVKPVEFDEFQKGDFRCWECIG